MRHQKLRGKFNRTSSHRRVMLRNMAASLLIYERITTTEAKAKAVRQVTEKLITLGKRGTLHARRIALSRIRNNQAVQKLFSQLAPRYENRPGGYTRIYHIDYRHGDAAPLAVIELVDRPEVPETTGKKEEGKRSLGERVRQAFSRKK